MAPLCLKAGQGRRGPGAADTPAPPAVEGGCTEIVKSHWHTQLSYTPFKGGVLGFSEVFKTYM